MPPSPAKLRPETLETLSSYVSLLGKWNAKINLIGRSTTEDIWNRHIADSLQLLEYLPQNPCVITDMGSGAGLPGLILAIARPDVTVHLIESNNKKASFLKEAARQCNAQNVTVHAQRIEQLTPWHTDIITARAFAPLPELLRITSPFYQKESLYLLLKGCKAEEEIEQATLCWGMNYHLYPSNVSTPGENPGFIVAISEVKNIDGAQS